jgi:hypothetical protein
VETFRHLFKRFKVLRKVWNIGACKTAHQWHSMASDVQRHAARLYYDIRESFKEFSVALYYDKSSTKLKPLECLEIVAWDKRLKFRLSA